MTRIVAITGCDSGLGWAIAARAAREGLLTIAGMHSGVDTNAATALKKLNVRPFPLDVTKQESIQEFYEFVSSVVNENPDNKLYAVVNNAGVMTVGNFEWQTQYMIENTIDVNLLGAMRVVKAFLPDLKQSAINSTKKPRIINIASHCGLQPLPSFAVYSASKAGLLAWTAALRHEHWAQGISAVAFVPGGFIGASNIMSKQESYADKMIESLREDEKLIHEKKIRNLTEYLKGATTKVQFDSLKDESITNTFVKTLKDENPRAMYKVETWRYYFYYNLLKFPLPESFKHWLIVRFVNFPNCD